MFCIAFFREKANALFQQKREEKLQRGKRVRQEMEEIQTAQSANVVRNLEVSVLSDLSSMYDTE